MSSFQELLALRQKKLSMALADTPEGGAGFIIIIITIITITITLAKHPADLPPGEGEPLGRTLGEPWQP